MLFLISNHKSYLIISGKAFHIIYCTDSKRILNLFAGRLLYVNEYLKSFPCLTVALYVSVFALVHRLAFWTSSQLSSASMSNPPLFLAPPHKKGGLQRNPPILIRQSHSENSNQPVQSSISQFHQVKHLR